MMDDDNKRTVYCGNLSDQVTEELFYELFLQAGPIEKVTLPKDKEGKRRGFGFILYKHLATVPYAVQLLTGESLFGKALRINAKGANEGAGNSQQIPRSYSAPNGFQPSPPMTPYAFQTNNPFMAPSGFQPNHVMMMNAQQQSTYCRFGYSGWPKRSYQEMNGNMGPPQPPNQFRSDGYGGYQDNSQNNLYNNVRSTTASKAQQEDVNERTWTDTPKHRFSDSRYESRDLRNDARDSRYESRDARYDGRDARNDGRDSRYEGRDSRFDKYDHKGHSDSESRSHNKQNDSGSMTLYSRRRLGDNTPGSNKRHYERRH